MQLRTVLELVMAALLGCGGSYKEAHEFQGQVYYTEKTIPSVGDRLAYGATHACSGGVRDDDRALRLVPALPKCPREELTVDYVPDGIHRIEACSERWKIKCVKRQADATSPTSFSSSSLECVVDCIVEDHFVTAQ